KSSLLEGLALARMRKQRRQLWRRSTLAHKNQPAKLHSLSVTVSPSKFLKHNSMKNLTSFLVIYHIQQSHVLYTSHMLPVNVTVIVTEG
ncbi:hypothetical protein L9F63_026037, partial [Diploptera punctata]